MNITATAHMVFGTMGQEAGSGPKRKPVNLCKSRIWTVPVQSVHLKLRRDAQYIIYHCIMLYQALGHIPMFANALSNS